MRNDEDVKSMRARLGWPDNTDHLNWVSIDNCVIHARSYPDHIFECDRCVGYGHTDLEGNNICPICDGKMLVKCLIDEIRNARLIDKRPIWPRRYN